MNGDCRQSNKRNYKIFTKGKLATLYTQTILMPRSSMVVFNNIDLPKKWIDLPEKRLTVKEKIKANRRKCHFARILRKVGI